jgi:hypothetical protein
MEKLDKAKNHTKQVNIRFTPSERQALDEIARRSGMNVSTWAREVLLEALGTSPGRVALLFQAAVYETNRLTAIALQEGESLSSNAVRDRIERQARATAEEVCERWLRLFKRQEKAA